MHRLAGNLGPLPPDVVDEIVERTDRVPLFVEELTKAVVEAGADRGYVSISTVPPSSLAVPATLHASLLGRLDRLGPAAKTVARIGAAIGRNFSYELRNPAGYAALRALGLYFEQRDSCGRARSRHQFPVVSPIATLVRSASDRPSHPRCLFDL